MKKQGKGRENVVLAYFWSCETFCTVQVEKKRMSARKGNDEGRVEETVNICVRREWVEIKRKIGNMKAGGKGGARGCWDYDGNGRREELSD